MKYVRHLGYACINDALNNIKPKTSTNRTLRKNSFEKKGGLKKASRKAILNLKDLLAILHWNQQHNVKLFRVSGSLFPWQNMWDWQELPNLSIVENLLTQIGDYAKMTGQRLVFHPGPFNKLCSPDPELIEKTIQELEYHSTVFDRMGFEPSFYNSINIHVGAAYGDKQATLKQFNENYSKLSDNLKKRLTVENDDRSALYTTSELYDDVYMETGIPIMFDFHHYQCHPDEHGNLEQILNKALSTWPDNITPICHWSESRQDEYGDSTITKTAHSDFCIGPLPDIKPDRKFDLMLEAKKKEQSLDKLIYSTGGYVHEFK